MQKVTKYKKQKTRGLSSPTEHTFQRYPAKTFKQGTIHVRLRTALSLTSARYWKRKIYLHQGRIQPVSFGGGAI